MAEKTTVKKQFVVGGLRLRATVSKLSDGWKIVSVGAVDVPISLLPFEVTHVAMGLVRLPAFPTKEAAYGALRNAEAAQ